MIFLRFNVYMDIFVYIMLNVVSVLKKDHEVSLVNSVGGRLSIKAKKYPKMKTSGLKGIAYFC